MSYYYIRVVSGVLFSKDDLLRLTVYKKLQWKCIWSLTGFSIDVIQSYQAVSGKQAFFISNLAYPQPTLGHYQRGRLINRVSITAFYSIVDPKVNWNLAKMLDHSAMEKAQSGWSANLGISTPQHLLFIIYLGSWQYIINIKLNTSNRRCYELYLFVFVNPLLHLEISLSMYGAKLKLCPVMVMGKSSHKWYHLLGHMTSE